MGRTIDGKYLYVVQKVTKEDKFYGKKHAWFGGDKTECGKEVTDNWYIMNNYACIDLINCADCLKTLSEDINKEVG